MTKIKQAKYFLGRINGVNLFQPVVIAKKIKSGEHLIGEIFYQRKISDLQYVCCVVIEAVPFILGVCLSFPHHLQKEVTDVYKMPYLFEKSPPLKSHCPQIPTTSEKGVEEVNVALEEINVALE